MAEKEILTHSKIYEQANELAGAVSEEHPKIVVDNVTIYRVGSNVVRIDVKQPKRGDR